MILTLTRTSSIIIRTTRMSSSSGDGADGEYNSQEASTTGGINEHTIWSIEDDLALCTRKVAKLRFDGSVTGSAATLDNSHKSTKPLTEETKTKSAKHTDISTQMTGSKRSLEDSGNADIPSSKKIRPMGK